MQLSTVKLFVPELCISTQSSESVHMPFPSLSSEFLHINVNPCCNTFRYHSEVRKHAIILIAFPGVLAQVCSLSVDSAGEKQFKTTCQPYPVSAGSHSAISFLQLLNVYFQQCSFSDFRKVLTSVTLQYCYVYLGE